MLSDLDGPAGDEVLMFGDETPRMGPSSYVVDLQREREREFLEALRFVQDLNYITYPWCVPKFRSPDPESAAARASVGGWGLGAGHEDIVKMADEEEDDEHLDWDQAQVWYLPSWKLNTSLLTIRRLL